MKLVHPAIAAVLLCAAPARAQWVVYDPAVHTQAILNQAEDVAKYVQMINNQMRQINQLTSQLRELEQYNRAFGDPATIVQVTGADALVHDLQHSGVGKTMTELQELSHGIDALKGNAHGIYHGVGETFTTPSGREVHRAARGYRPNAALNRTAQNYTNVFSDVQRRRKALKTEIAATTKQLQAAKTDAETQKLTGVLVGLNAALAATDKEVDQALGLALVQDAENRNDATTQARARTEEQQAEFSDSLQSYRDTFKLTSEPARFPESR